MAKKYPAVGHKRKPKSNSVGGLPCIVCGKLTTGKVDIEVSWFRGDDEQVRVCAADQKNDEVILARYVDVRQEVRK